MKAYDLYTYETKTGHRKIPFKDNNFTLPCRQINKLASTQNIHTRYKVLGNMCAPHFLMWNLLVTHSQHSDWNLLYFTLYQYTFFIVGGKDRRKVVWEVNGGVGRDGIGGGSTGGGSEEEMKKQRDRKQSMLEETLGGGWERLQEWIKFQREE